MIEKIISNNISYIECSDDPLSADIGIVKTDNGIWLYDVGNNKDIPNIFTDEYNIVLSHFHADHIGNIDNIKAKEIYLSKKTLEHVKRGQLVDKDIYIDNLHIFLLPSSHAKGCVCLEVDDGYTFVGDALYSKVDATHYIFNSQLLREEIRKLKELKSRYLLVSHHTGLVRERLEVIEELESYYGYRRSDSNEIRIEK